MSSYQVVRSKMDKTRALLTDAKLERYIPKTKLFNNSNLEAMLKEFEQVYVKPDCGRGGKRVISIRLQKNGDCKIHYETTVTKADKIAAAAKFIEKVAAGDRFIIQQGISLLSIGQVPFDLRINVQKPYSKWEVTSMIAKKMAPGKPVTNYSQGSTLVQVDQALLRAGLSRSKVNKLKSLLTELGERTASVLSQKYSGLRELGLDVGLDRNVDPWILEVNTKPKYPKGLSSKFDRYRRIIQS